MPVSTYILMFYSSFYFWLDLVAFTELLICKVLCRCTTGLSTTSSPCTLGSCSKPIQKINFLSFTTPLSYSDRHYLLYRRFENQDILPYPLWFIIPTQYCYSFYQLAVPFLVLQLSLHQTTNVVTVTASPPGSTPKFSLELQLLIQLWDYNTAYTENAERREKSNFLSIFASKLDF